MPDMDSFVGSAARHGHLVYWMNQSLTDPIAQDGPWGNVSDGYCAGLAVRWIRLAYQGTDYKGAPGYVVGGEKVKWFNGTDWQATVYQNKIEMFNNAVHPTAPQRIAYALGLAQMFLASDLQEDANTRPTGQKLARIVKQSYGCYYVSLRGTEWAHAIAMRHAKPPGAKGPGVFQIFDSNHGHFAWQIKSADWAQIIDSYFYFSGYDKDYRAAYTIGRATPPIY